MNLYQLRYDKINKHNLMDKVIMPKQKHLDKDNDSPFIKATAIDYSCYLFCDNCKSIFAKSNRQLASMSFDKLICPCCKETSSCITSYDNKAFNIASSNVYLDDNKIKIVINFKNSYFNYDKIKISSTITTLRVVMNLDTGNTYALPALMGFAKKRNKNKVSKNYIARYFNRLYNITFTDKINILGSFVYNSNILRIIKEEDIKRVFDYIVKYKKLDTNNTLIKRNIEYLNKRIDNKIDSLALFKDLMCFNRIPYFNLRDREALSNYNTASNIFLKDKLKKNYGCYDMKKSEKIISKIRLKLKNNVDPNSVILKALNIDNNKENKQLLNIGIKFLCNKELINKAVDDINNLRKLSEINLDNSLITLKNFLEQLIVIKNHSLNYKENIFINKLVEDMAFYSDIYEMLKQILEKQSNYKMNCKGSLKTIHDNLMFDFDKITQEKVIFDINESTLKLSEKFIGYDFVIAKDSFELKRVGKEMGICVGSYGYKVENGHCNILIVYENKKPVVCIELLPINRDVRDTRNYFKSNIYNIINQVKLKYNYTLKNNDKLVYILKEYFEKHNLNYLDNYDCRAFEINEDFILKVKQINLELTETAKMIQKELSDIAIYEEEIAAGHEYSILAPEPCEEPMPF